MKTWKSEKLQNKIQYVETLNGDPATAKVNTIFNQFKLIWIVHFFRSLIVHANYVEFNQLCNQLNKQLLQYLKKVGDVIVGSVPVDHSVKWQFANADEYINCILPTNMFNHASNDLRIYNVENLVARFANDLRICTRTGFYNGW